MMNDICGIEIGHWLIDPLETISPLQGLDRLCDAFPMGRDPSLCYCAPLGLVVSKEPHERSGHVKIVR